MAIAPWRTARAGFDGVRGQIGIRADALQPLMHRVAVGENVMRRFPIPMLIRRAEPGDTQRSRITKRAAEVSEIGPIRDRGLERGDDRARIVAQEKLGQLGVLQPRASITTNCEQVGSSAAALRTALRGPPAGATPLTHPRPAPPPFGR